MAALGNYKTQSGSLLNLNLLTASYPMSSARARSWVCIPSYKSSDFLNNLDCHQLYNQNHGVCTEL